MQTTNAPVVATSRKDLDKTKEELLEGLSVDEKRLTVLKLDVLGTYWASKAVLGLSTDNVLDEATIADAAASCKKQFSDNSNALQLAFIVPGILFPEKSPTQIKADDALLTFRTNTLVRATLDERDLGAKLTKTGSDADAQALLAFPSQEKRFT